MCCERLRKGFPRAWFFTTDLDAGFWHPEEFDYARNVLVASHFGLSLQRNLQGSVAPFRDSYQTATFFAIQLALTPGKTGERTGQQLWGSLDPTDPWGLQGSDPDPDKHLKPLIFEIGRHGPYQLTRIRRDPPTTRSDGSNGSTAGKGSAVRPGLAHPEASQGGSADVTAMIAVHPPGPRDVPLKLFSWAYGPLIVVGTLSLLFCLWYFDRHTRQVVGVLVSPLRRLARAEFRDLCADVPLTALGWLTVALVVFVTWAIWHDHTTDGGEPFSLVEGISVWPSVLIRLLVVVLGLVFLFTSLFHLQANQNDLCPHFSIQRQADGPRWQIPPDLQTELNETKLPKWRGILPLPWEQAVNQPHELYVHYCWLGLWYWRLARVALLTGLYLIFGVCLFIVQGFPNAPTRGIVCDWITFLVTIAAVIVMIALLMYVLDATQWARFFVRKLGEQAHHWSVPDGNLAEAWFAVAPEERGEWRAIQVIGQHTRAISRVFWLPCTLVFLMIVSRLPYIDNWDFPWALLVLVLLNLAAAVFCGAILRLEAGKAREQIVAHLRMKLAAAVGAAGKETAPQAAQLQRMIADIESTSTGAFSPLSQDPLLLSLSLPFGGASGLLFLEQVMRWM